MRVHLQAPASANRNDDLIQRTCTKCAAKQPDEDDTKKPRIQPKLALGATDDPLEEEAERNAARVVGGEALEPETEEDDEEEDTMRARRRQTGGPEDPPAGFREELGATSRGGSPLSPELRGSMERAFSYDFSAVQIHDDSTANALAASIGASAFTHGTHVYFGAQAFQPNTREGKHLLAHELTHVVQQRGSAGGPIRRQRKKKNKKKKRGQKKSATKIGYLHFYDSSEKSFATDKFYDVRLNTIELPEGVYRVEIQGVGGSRQLVFPGIENIDPIEIENLASGTEEHFEKAAVVRLQVIDSSPDAKDVPTPDPPDFEGVYGEFDAQGTLILPAGSGVEPLQLPKTDDPAAPPADDPKSGDPKSDDPKSDDVDPDAQKGTKEQTGDGTDEETQAGSKYGWLGILKLPPSWIKALETAFEAMGDAEEFLAIEETIKGLIELYDHRNELVDAFSSPEKLVETLLGIEDNAAMDALAAWVGKSNKDSEKKISSASDDRLKGVLAIASKVVRILQNIRKILKPIFLTREKVKAIFEGVMGTIAGLESIEELMDAGSNISELGSGAIKDLINKAAGELGEKLDASLKGIFEALKFQITTFGDDDFITYEELARAVTAAALKFVPYPYKLGVKAASALGLDDALADNLVAELIPKDVLDGVNSAIRSFANVLEPTINGAVEGLEEVLTGLSSDLSTELPGFFESAFAQASRAPNAPQPARRALDRAERAIDRSRGAPLPPAVRDELEGRLGFDFERVRVHMDGAAAAASHSLGVNAFTVGSHVFFAPGRFQPDSEEGRKLLAHELTHAEQQSGEADPALVQADWKSLRRRLVAKFGDKIKNALTLSRTGSKDDLERAGRVRTWIDANLGKPIKEKDLKDPDFKAAYSVVKKKKKISLRRKLKYLGLVPGLTINEKKKKSGTLGTLELGVLAKMASFDPKKRARAALRRSLGCKSGEEAHHIVPLELEDHPLIKLARSNNWNMNDGNDNGVCLTTHSGSHPIYTAEIRDQLDAIYAETGDDWTKAKPKLDKLITTKRAWCLKQTSIK